MGWGLSNEQLEWLNKRATEMRRNPTEPEKRLWRHLSNSQLAGHKFRCQSVIGPYIADFLCRRKALIGKIHAIMGPNGAGRSTPGPTKGRR